MAYQQKTKQLCFLNAEGKYLPPYNFKWRQVKVFLDTLPLEKKTPKQNLLAADSHQRKTRESYSSKRRVILGSILRMQKRIWSKKRIHRDFPGGPVARTLCSQCRDLGSSPAQGTRSHMPQPRPRAAKFFFFRKLENIKC